MAIFFISWELWQQMTFVLAMAIVAVFCAGLVKLWWINRLMAKQEILDEEKRARLQEMRKTGIPAKRAHGIPFGVRAIQSGVEVDGIWISRPATPLLNEKVAKVPSTSTLVDLDHPEPQKRANNASEDTRSTPASALNPERAAPGHSASDGSIFQRLAVGDSGESSPTLATPVSQFASPKGKQRSREPSVLNEDTLRRLEGQSQAKPAYDTYQPTSSPRNPRQPSQRSSASSSGDSVRSASQRSYTSSRSSQLYMSRNMKEKYNAVPQTWPENDQRDSSYNPARTPYSQSENYSRPLQTQDPSRPEPTFGPGDPHVNRSSRRVNNGFEVLPAGTFGLPN
ncbi:hypothetical protein B0T19DRAFT_12121 [Cercophora scortea]|uniref:Uncharacterized protein n=1 Tax=Cercophora scortea TaxID=314031 RepID=A0AAE0J295_9PEZI|nr:hypothetical protein B0T19DRAFT_12121 [Cercophora scortea]